MPLAQLPVPPYYVVTFASQRTEGDHGYGAMADEMVALAAKQPGYLGVESARGVKDVARIRGFIRAARAAASGLVEENRR